MEILKKFKIFQDHRIRKFSIIIDLRKVDFLSAEKINECSRFVNKDISQSHLSYAMQQNNYLFEYSNDV